jgi:ABC-type antimicrobial peptide transport system permease subunit
MSTLRLVLASLAFHWRIHAAVALGVAAATAVLTGALLVGDSVRGSLKQLAFDRLGRIDELLIVDRFFRRELVQELAASPRFAEAYSAAVPAILFPAGTVERATDTGRRRASGVTVIGADRDFWNLGDPQHSPKRAPGEGEIILNAPLADEVGAAVGDLVVDRIANLAELKVIEIIAAQSLGRFSLVPMQNSPKNAYVSLGTLAEGLDVSGRANAIFVAGRSAETPPDKSASQRLAAALKPQLSDLGLTLKHVRQVWREGNVEDVVFDYFTLSSDRMMIDAVVEREALAAFSKYQARPVLTYLANRIEKIGSSATGDKSPGIPYSTITAIDPAVGGPLVDRDGQPLPPLADDEIVLTSWAADDQKVQSGDRVRVTFFEPETTHGDEKETSAEFRVAAIVPLTEPAKGFTRRAPAVFVNRPTPANDPDLTPEVQGITDQATIADWDAPFPFNYKLVRDEDDTYWDHHRTTPKAYISLAAGRRIWGSRFGQSTSIRIPAGVGMTVESLAGEFLAQLDRDGERLGMEFRPIKRQGLTASSGTTPFDVLFLLLSMFVIASAVMLVWLLFRLGIEQRAGEVGTLLALGWTRSHSGRALLLEGAIVAALGAVLGVAVGVAYAWLMLTGLRTWWVGAISSPFLTLYATPASLVVGFFAGLAISALTIWLGLRSLRRVAVRRLMAGEATAESQTLDIGHWSLVWNVLIPGVLLTAAMGLAILAASLGGEAQAGAFLGAGALVLIALLLVIAGVLRGTGAGEKGIFSSAALLALAVRNAGRSVGRSLTTIALMASAAFLIVAVSSFRLSPTGEGVGGFQWLAESSEPVIADLNSPIDRKSIFGTEAEKLAGTTVVPFRLKAGDDASCRNLYQPTQPRILGVTPALSRHFEQSHGPRFGFAASAAKTDEERADPWRLLAQRTPTDQPVPVILDKNTARYSLRLYLGVGEEFEVTYDGERTIRFRVAGLLENSVLQGNLLIGEADFTRLFPQISGYRFFLIETPADKSAAVAALLEDKLGDEGFDTADTHARLTDLLAVQNTYISTFQSLGALGLLLGTVGLAAVQLRSVLERRKELALLRAAGFRRFRLGEMVLLENLLLLFGGLAAGTLAALVTVLPHMILGGARAPLAVLLAMLGVVLVAGIVTGLWAVRATLRAPLVAALRGE